MNQGVARSYFIYRPIPSAGLREGLGDRLGAGSEDYCAGMNGMKGMGNGIGKC